MEQFSVTPIGYIRARDGRFTIELKEEYRPALREVGAFSHINVLWWFSGFDSKSFREIVEMDAPYKKGPRKMGVFATRSPIRPNPIALSACQIIHVNLDTGSIELEYIDAHDNSPVLDIKPYTPSLDLVSKFISPAWCSHWPKSVEDSESFSWEDEFNF